MSELKATPGPWEIERLSDGCVGIIGDVRVVADDEEHCTQVVEFQPMSEDNAHLIATAPAMYHKLGDVEELMVTMLATASEGNVVEIHWLKTMLQSVRETRAAARGES